MAKRIRKKSYNQKPENENKINGDITAPEVRLVGDNLDDIGETIGTKIETGVYKTNIAKDWAREMGLDLVEISGKANPPVVKIIDYKKYLYDQKKKQKEIKNKASKTTMKVIRFGPNTDDHDFNFKLNHAKKFLEDGNKVRAYVHFKGRTIVFKDRGELLLLKFLKELEEYGSAESLPTMEGNRMSVTLQPIKKKK